jgi:hypothetical protein
MKNIYKVLLFLLVIFLFCITSPGCKKAVEHKIVGTWSLVHVDNLNNKDINEWIFTDNKEVYFDKIPYGNSVIHQDTGTYKVSTSIGKKYVEITECSSELNNNKYRIMKLNSRMMKLIIESNHGLLFFEFTKVN